MNSRGPFTFTQLDLPILTPEVARSAVEALAGISGQPRVVLEARGTAGRVNWYLGADAATTDRVLAAISHHVDGLRTRDGSQAPGATAAAAVRIPGHKGVLLDTSATEYVARSVLGALAGAHRGELVRLQVILGPRHRPHRIGDVPRTERTQVKAKYSERRFSCELRIGAKAADTNRARRLIGNVAAAMRALEAPGVSLHLKKSSLHALDQVRDPYLWPTELGVSEVTALLGWPIASKDTSLPGVPPTHPRLLPVASQIPQTGRILGDSVLDALRPVAQGVEEAKRVLHVIGPMGTGKSTMVVGLALADAAAGRSVILIDAKGDAVTEFLERVDAKRHEDVVVFSPTDAMPVGLDAFNGDADRAADVIYQTIRNLYGDQIGPRSSQVLQAALLTLARAGGRPLAMLPMLLINPKVRRDLVAKVSTADPMGLGAFWAHFEAMTDAEQVHVTSPLRNKLDPILTLRPGLRAMFGQREPRFNLRDVFMHPTKRPIIVADLGSAELGPAGAALWGSILLALIWHAAQERTKMPPHQRHPVMLYADEFQEIVRLGDLADALGRARGLGLAFAALSHQSLSQLSPSMRQAVLAHARSRVCFQLSPQDAKDIAATTNGVLVPQDLQELPVFTAQASLLVDGNRTGWCTIRTRPLPQVLQPAEVVRELSRQRYGRPIADVEAELLAAGGWTRSNGSESFGRSRRTGTGGSS